MLLEGGLDIIIPTAVHCTVLTISWHKEVGQELENRSTHLGFSMWSRSCLNVQYVQNMPFCHRNCMELLLDSNLCDFRLWPGTCDIHSVQH